MVSSANAKKSSLLVEVSRNEGPESLEISQGNNDKSDDDDDDPSELNRSASDNDVERAAAKNPKMKILKCMKMIEQDGYRFEEA